MARIKNEYDLTNKKFNSWLVICKSNKLVKSDSLWYCKCDCGILQDVRSKSLRNNLSKSCKQCSNIKQRKLNGLNYRLIWSILDNAKIRNIPVELGNNKYEIAEFLHHLFYVVQKEKCALSGMKLIIAPSSKLHRDGHSTASLDRIDNNKAYTKNNVQFVHKTINKMKMDLCEDKFIEFCINIAKHKG